MIPAPIWRCWTVPARVVRAVPRVARRHVWRPVRHFAIHHAVAVGAAVVIPATVACILVPGWLAAASPSAVEGGGASLVWYGGGPAGFGSPVGGAPFGIVEAGEIGGCCGVSEEERRHHHHHHVEHKPPVRIPEPDTLALLGFGAVMMTWLRRRREPPVTTIRPAIAQLDRDIADRAERRALGLDVVAIDMGIAEHGRRLAEEMGDKS